MDRRSRWLGAVAILIALLVGTFALAAVAVFIVDPNDYKPRIVAAVQAATGRALTLNGPLRVSKSLWPTIEAIDVKLANLPGGTRPDMATAERIEAQLSLPALLWGRVEVTRLTLIGPNILFEEVAHKPNWEFGAEGEQIVEPSNQIAAPANQTMSPGSRIVAPARSSATGAALRFRNVYVENGMVTFRLPARTKVVGIRSLDFHHLQDDGPLEVASVLVYSDNQPFRFRASAQPTAGIADPWNTQLRFAAYDTIASAKGTMNLAGDYNLQVEGDAGALEKLNALLPEMQLPALHQMSFATSLTNGPVRGDLPVIGKTRLHIGSADLDDRLPRLKLGAFEVSLPTAGAIATVSGEGNYAGQWFALDGTFAVPEHLDGPARFPVNLTAHAQAATNGGKASGAAQGSLNVKGELALNTGRFGGLDAAIALRTPALITARPMVSAALPALTSVSLDGRLVLPADGSSLTFRGVNLSAREGDLTGDATIGLGSAVALDAQLQSTRIDMDALRAAFRASATTTPTGSTTAGPLFSDVPLPWAALRGPVLNVKATIASITFQQRNWQNVELALQLHGGLLQVDRLFLGLPGLGPSGGQLTASLSADATTDNAPVNLVLHAPDIPLALIARYANLPGQAEGTVKLDADLHAVGRSSHDLAASLEGSFGATMTAGSLSNAALIKLASASLTALSIRVPEQGQTAIHCFGLLGTFKKGVGRFDTIAFDTTFLKLDGVGQIDLGTETMALKLHPLAQLSGSSVAVPVLVEGPIRGAKGRLDATGLDQLGLLIDAWFGGDRPKTCSDAGLVPPRAAEH